MKYSNMLNTFILISIHFLIFPKMSNSNSCNTMSCKSIQNSHSISIKYPFRVSDHQPKSCGSPGFNLHCDDNHPGPLLDLPEAGNFTVESINYPVRKIELSDPNDCLPQKLLSLNLSTTPFRAISRSKDFRVYNCSKFDDHNDIVCLRGSNYRIVSGRAGEIVTDSNCTLLKIVSVPTKVDLRHLTNYSSIYLTWDKQRDCESCGSATKTSPKSSHSLVMNSSRMMATVISTFVVVILICILVTLCLRMTKHDAEQQAAAATTTTTTTTATTTTTTTTNNTIHNLLVAHRQSSSTPPEDDGLDQITINSYPMVVIGESGRLIKLSDNKCSICLSDYFPGDTLIILPECLHRFHVDCIRLWLSAKPTCPICRTSPRNS